MYYWKIIWFEKKCIVILMLCLSTSIGYGQRIAMGFSGGVNVSSLNVSGSEYKPGYQYGTYLRVMPRPNLGLQSEIAFSQQYADYNGTPIKTTYLHLPLLMKFEFGGVLHLMFGPQYHLLLNQNGTSRVNEGLKSKYVSFALGVGTDLPMGFSMTLRFNNAINDLYSESGDLSSDAVQLSVFMDLFELRQ